MNPNATAHPYAYLYAAPHRAGELRAEAQRARELRAALADRSVRFQLTHFLALLRQPRLT